MISNSALETILTSGDDFSVVVELYSSDAVPPFDPNDALLRYSAADTNYSDLEFFGADYTRLIKSFGQIKRTITEELNSAQIELVNLENDASDYELTEGYEALIKVIRLISRSDSDTLEKSLILFAGRCEQPTGGNRESLSIKANQIFGAIDAEIPRRKFSPDDPNGLPPQDINFEGFRYSPQYGTVAYSSRERAGGLLGLFGFKHNLTRYAQANSFSDLDAERYLPVGLGRVQVSVVHLGYIDLGTQIRFTAAVMEGKIQDLINWRTDDPRFTIFSTVHKRMGYEANGTPPAPNDIYQQIPIPDQPGPNGHWIATGYYANTAMFSGQCQGTNVQTVDAAPGIIVVVLAALVTIPDGSGDWVTTDKWSDNPAAHTRFILTSDHYGKLDSAWLNDESFYQSYLFNNEFIFDTSNSDLIFTPDTDLFDGGDKEKSHYFISTGYCGPDYFKFLNGDKTESETYLQTPLAEPYDDHVPIEPPPREPTEPGGTSRDLTYFIRRRYTDNVVVSEQTKVTDFVHKSIFTTCRGFLSQDEQGRLKMNNKKPADWCLATEEVSGTAFDVDDVSKFVDDPTRFLLIDPHTSNAEIRIIGTATYSDDVPELESESKDLTLGTFTGGNGDDIPQTTTIAVSGGFSAGEIFDVTLDGTEFSFAAGLSDTTATVAAFIYATINAHPVLSRKFKADWAPGSDTVTLTYLSGTITLTEAVEMTHVAPLADPTAAPSIAGSSGGTFDAGVYQVCYTYANERGETNVSPVEPVTLTLNQKIDVTGVSLPSGASEIRWYCSPAKDSLKLRFVYANNGTGFSITELPKLNAPLIPTFNRTGAEVLRVQAVFSDRAGSRWSASRSNVLKATYKWRLPNAKPINQINLKYRDSTQDFRLIELILRDDAHIAKIKKVNKLEVNGQGIDNYNQAYRNAAYLLAENLDANFFYEWSADRTALLLEEGDVVAITDRGSGVVNFPVRIESNEYDIDSGFVKVSFTGRKYATTLYDDSAAERTVPVIVEPAQDVAFA